jgi:hypothetical protein
MTKITPLVKGLITGVILIGTNLLFNYTGYSNESVVRYLFYAIYAAGIAWTLIGYYRSPEYQPAFGKIFGQGFRSFIIITIIGVIFTGIYYKMHPEIRDEQAIAYKAELVKRGGKTPAEIDKEVNEAKDRFVTTNIYFAAIGSVILGAIFTSAGAGLLLIRRK